MKTIFNTILFLLILISNVYGKIINIDCKIFISDTNTYEKSWSLDKFISLAKEIIKIGKTPVFFVEKKIYH